MKENSCVYTLVTQISLCFALYLAFKVGQPQEALLEDRTTGSSEPFDFYFISVAGDFWPQKKQALLLRQMAKVAELYKAKFVVSISELGEDDPLSRNATRYFWSVKIPWYTTKSFKGQGTDHYIKHAKIRYGKTMDIIFLNTQSFQGSSNGAREYQLSWLTKTLEESISDWRIVVGFHPLLSCNVTTEAKDSTGPLHHLLIKYEVNAYLNGCKEYLSEGATQRLNDASSTDKGPCLTPVNKILPPNKERVDGFLLHRVSSFEFVTYLLKLNGEVVHKIELKQIGKEVM